MKAQDWFGLFIRCVGILIFLGGIYLVMSILNVWLATRTIELNFIAGSVFTSLAAILSGHLMLRHANAIVRYTYRDE